MTILVAFLGFGLILLTLWDAFETIILPRTVQRKFGFGNLFYGFAWSIYYPLLSRMEKSRMRQSILVAFAPISVILLIGLWAFLLLIGFAGVLWGFGVGLRGAPAPAFGEYLYYSGVTFFTLGFGDMTPESGLGRFFAVAEAATGFAFLALVISYVPVMYGAFAQRETQIVLLDTRAGSNPTAAELLRRHAEAQVMPEMTPLLKEWERWSGELLTSYLSFPTLAYYRSQHDDQSWLQALTAIMDVCALIDSSLDDKEPWQKALRFQARATFAMARHVIVDLAYIVNVPPLKRLPIRMSPRVLQTIRDDMKALGCPLLDGPVVDERLRELRALYEPYVAAMAKELLVTLPEWIAQERVADHWQTSAWDGARHF